MKARLFLIFISIMTILVIATNGRNDFYEPKQIYLMGRAFLVNSEMFISVIILSTLFLVFLSAVVERIFFTKKFENKD
mgnify:CR=1 FL=1|tara:strand:+ start:303 stop:536 length:234 start_codon:yes stop_codon:yes gene_type:complete